MNEIIPHNPLHEGPSHCDTPNTVNMTQQSSTTYNTQRRGLRSTTNYKGNYRKSWMTCTKAEYTKQWDDLTSQIQADYINPGTFCEQKCKNLIGASGVETPYNHTKIKKYY